RTHVPRRLSITMSVVLVHPSPDPRGFSSLSLHDALPISSTSCGRRGPSTARPTSRPRGRPGSRRRRRSTTAAAATRAVPSGGWRSEEHTSELQSQSNLVCRLLLEKKNTEEDLNAPVLSLV